MKLKKLISKTLAVGLILNSPLVLTAGVLSEDMRYETFEGNSITIDNILEENEVDVEIEGNTLVNLVESVNIQNNAGIIQDDIIIVDSSLHDITGGIIIQPKYLKESTTYTLFYNIVENNNYVGAFLLDNFETYPPNKPVSMSVNTGRNLATFTTKDALYKNNIKIVTNSNQGSGSLKISNLMLFEGDLSNNHPTEYFEGMKSVGELEDNKLNIESIGENLFDVEYFKEMIETHYDEGNYGYEIKNGRNAIWVTNNHNMLLGKNILNNNFKFKKNTSYIIKGNKMEDKNNYHQSLLFYLDYTDGTHTTFFFNTSKEWNECYFVTDKNKTVDKITFTYGSGMNKSWFDLDSLYIGEYNPDKTEFNYNYSIQNLKIDLKKPLRALPNGIKDRIIKKDGKWMIERNCYQIDFKEGVNLKYAYGGESNPTNIVLYMSWNQLELQGFPRGKSNNPNSSKSKDIISNNLPINAKAHLSSKEGIGNDINGFNISLSRERIGANESDITVEKAIEWLISNDSSLIYQLEAPIYEVLNTDLSINLFKDTTHISNNSTIPANMKVVIDRTINRATEAIELAKENPTTENLARARMWVNLLDESNLKDELQEEISNITSIEDIQLEKKTATANLDLYVKSENSLSMSLSTNSITFEGYSGVENIENLKAVEISINSSLPYDLNAYLESQLYNSDKSKTIDIDLLKIKESSKTSYQSFINTAQKIVLKEDCPSGNFITHDIDLKLEGGDSHESDVYRTTIKFEATQK